MKQLILLITLIFVWQHAQAASFTKVTQMTDERLNRLVEIHDELAHIYDNCATRGLLQISARRINEKWENTVKQAVYFTNTGANAPMRGVKAEILNLKEEVQLGYFMQGAFSANVNREEVLTKEDERMLNKFRAILGTLRGDYQFYSGGLENTFGEVSLAVVVDLVNAEVLVLEAGECR